MTSLVRTSALIAALAVSPAALAQTTTTTTTVTKETTGPVRLTPEQRTTVYRSVTREQPAIARPALGVRYEIGAPIPRGGVELSTFPEDVYVDVPVLKRYRYVYVNHQLVLVDPQTSEVVDVITD